MCCCRASRRVELGRTYCHPQKFANTKQVHGNWDWFECAQSCYPELGTLGFLPREICDQIFEKVFLMHCKTLSIDGCTHTWANMDCHYCRRLEYLEGFRTNRFHYQPSTDVISMPDHHTSPDVFSISVYVPRGNYRTDMSIPFCLVSQTCRLEFDEVFLSTNTFKFSCPKSLEQFLSAVTYLSHQSSAEQQTSPLRRVVIELFGSCSCCLGEERTKECVSAERYPAVSTL